VVAAVGGGGQIRQCGAPNCPISRCRRPAQLSQLSRRVTAPRIIVPGATTAITRRATLRKAFLAPWHPGVEQAWLYSLALAQKHTGVAIHHATRVITHNHLTVTPERDNLPCFTRMFHHELSCALNTLLAQQRYDQPGELFDGRATHMMRLCDDAAQSTQLIYEYLNPVAAGLVSRPEHMPGFVFDFELWRKGYLDVRRPDFYFSDSQPELLRLEVTPPPLLYLAFEGELDKLVHAMKRLAEHSARELRARQKRAPLGARAITRLHPWSEPRTLRESRGRSVPTFRIGARGIVGQQAHIEAARETRGFRHGHERARLARKGGDFAHEFPYGTYQMRVQHGVPVAEPDFGTGIVTRPGPTLRQVQRMLEQRAARDHGGEAAASAAARFELMDRAREALLDEADAICEHASDGMDFQHPQRAPTASAPDARLRSGEGRREGNEHGDHGGAQATVEHEDAADDGAPVIEHEDAADDGAPVIVRHRFDKRSCAGGDREARRIITLRDRRRGRPRTSRHGTDPPG
jgi:hypothetical protein